MDYNDIYQERDEHMSIVIKAQAMWAQLSRVNDMSGKYQIDLTQLSEAASLALGDAGISVRHSDEKGNFITCKSQHIIRAFDPDGAQLPEDLLIGNGSEVKAAIKPYSWSFKGKEGVSPSLQHLTVVDLVAYEADTAEAI